VVLDVEDAVPTDLKDRARHLVAEVAAATRCWVRINRALTDAGARDLEALHGKVGGLRLPKVESAADVEWVAARAPGVALDCSIESALGIVNAFAIASSKACSRLSYGGVDLALDLGSAGGDQDTLFARSSLVVAARAAGKPAPSDGVYTRLDDEDGLRRDAEAARRLGFFGKSAVHPRQVAVINEVFTASPAELAWAERVLAAFKASSGAATQLPDGEFVDIAVAERARRLLRGL
jgi:citrate lyase subunit beta/citryl-CoA lyase